MLNPRLALIQGTLKSSEGVDEGNTFSNEDAEQVSRGKWEIPGQHGLGPRHGVFSLSPSLFFGDTPTDLGVFHSLAQTVDLCGLYVLLMP